MSTFHKNFLYFPNVCQTRTSLEEKRRKYIYTVYYTTIKYTVYTVYQLGEIDFEEVSDTGRIMRAENIWFCPHFVVACLTAKVLGLDIYTVSE